ncbi:MULTISPECIES: alpha-L-fucosidase [unclassified Pseudoalteromonas]|uniref:alpha-L-fucosidase n=1 Tax=unclassified Pseudoalteromonas TaxID=194690 RepID=UPI0025B52C11|nr:MULTISPECIES: alpha-L-fucosidase [unclassified Pseudoalteromonas]MDN3377711.1 alpha-L-fucosidase [Pseudoalteromonas sp. APC 3893]MDN3385907.1 alpha-L-fucosidase [Pseudoalteromonas sp. APC 4017]
MKIFNTHLFSGIASAFILSSTFSVYAQENSLSMDELWGETSMKASQNVDKSSQQQFMQDKYSMFIHWGLYSIPAGEWKGKTYYGISEWLMSDRVADIAVDEYKKLATDFYPDQFDAKAIVKMAVDAGMKNIVITAKHHEGFAMYHSKSSDYDIEDATSFSRDPLKELAQACQEAGIGLGFYYSQMQDWYEQGGAGVSWSSPEQKGDFDTYFEEKVVPQVTELLTQYGPIRTVWFDTPGSMTKEQSMKLVHLVRNLQPKSLINSRIGNGVGDFSTLGDHSLSEVNHPGLWETIDTTNNSWGYAWYDKNWKSGTEILRRLISTVGRGGNYMLNIGPDAKGRVPELAKAGLESAGQWLKQYGFTIYGAQSSPWGRAQSWGDITVQGNKVYLHVFDWPEDGKIHLSGLQNRILSSKLLGSDAKKVSVKKQSNGWLTVNVPFVGVDERISVIELEVVGAPKVDDTPGIDPSITTILNSAFADCNGCKNAEIRWMQKFGDWNYANNLMDWQNNAKGSWHVDVAKSGFYRLEVEYSADDVVDFSEWFINFGEQYLMLQALDTGERKNSLRQSKGRTLYRYRTDVVGVIELNAGKQNITVTPKDKVVGGGINLKAIHLVPVEK